MAATLTVAKVAAGRLAVDLTESAIKRHVRLTDFHPAEADAAYLALADALVLLAEQGADALATHQPATTCPVELVMWRRASQMARRALDRAAYETTSATDRRASYSRWLERLYSSAA